MHCWRCGKLSKRPVKRTDWPAQYSAAVGKLYGIKKPTVGDLRKALPLCQTCEGSGKIRKYAFNPFSGPQQFKLLVEHLGAPKHTFRGKDTMDEQSLKRILKWAES